MGPEYVVFWAAMAVLAGFLSAYIARWDRGVSLAVLSLFVTIGLAFGTLLGNPFWPTFLAAALTVGLAWGCAYWYEPASCGPAVPRGTWGERMARWGFPSTERMERQVRRP